MKGCGPEVSPLNRKRAFWNRKWRTWNGRWCRNLRRWLAGPQSPQSVKVIKLFLRLDWCWDKISWSVCGGIIFNGRQKISRTTRKALNFWLDSSCPYWQIWDLRLNCKNFLRRNTLSYFLFSSVTKKVFCAIDCRCHGCKAFFLCHWRHDNIS